MRVNPFLSLILNIHAAKEMSSRGWGAGEPPKFHLDVTRKH